MNVAYNTDCLTAMREYPEKYFDLADHAPARRGPGPVQRDDGADGQPPIAQHGPAGERGKGGFGSTGK